MDLSRITVIFSVTFAALLSTSALADEHKRQAVSIVKQFGGQLKPELKQAMIAGGPQAAIDVCTKRAPDIAHSLSNKTGWKVSRVSSKNRNPDAMPSKWEAKVLQSFEQKIADGAEPKSLVYSAKVDGEYRFMKAQVIEPLCLNCHGTQVSDDIQQKIKLYYPGDKAMGYELGQLRGAFSLSVPVAD